MIPRILVPTNVRPAAARPSEPPRRLSSPLDARKLVPPDLPQFVIDTHSSIPAYFKLEVLGSNIVVPRDMPNTPLDVTSKTPDYVPMAILNSRVAVPKDAHPAFLAPKPRVAIQDLPDVLDPDVITTGEVNLMARHVEEQTAAWNSVSHLVSVGYIVLVGLFVLFGPGRNPTPQIATAALDNQDINYLFAPPDLKDVMRRPAPPRLPPGPAIRVDPRILRQISPPHLVQPNPTVQDPERVDNDVPAATAKPAPIAPPTQQALVQQPQESPIRIPQPPANAPTPSITLPQFSPGKALQESLHEALKDGGTPSAQFGGGVPAPGGGGPGGGGGGQGNLGGDLQMLTPTEGVDFSSYLARVIASIKRNWYAVMPESANLGDRGRVALDFDITRNGVVPESDPIMVATSGKEPLDRAAVSSIRASTPFEPLPSAFSGPFIKLRIIFLYNLPLNTQ